MKKIVLLWVVFSSMIFKAQADEYAYLTFETTDGGKCSVKAASLSITLSGTTLTAGDKTFVLSNLSKMYFSSSDLTTAISSIRIEDMDDTVEVYDLNGRKVSKDQLSRGVYVVKSKKGNYKIAVR